MVSPEHARQAPARRDGFPIERDPRPIVLTRVSPQRMAELMQDLRQRPAFDGPGAPESALPPRLRHMAARYCRGGNPTTIRGHGPFGVWVDRIDPYAETREVVVRLAAPLGDRVLIWTGAGPGTFGTPRTVLTS